MRATNILIELKLLKRKNSYWLKSGSFTFGTNLIAAATGFLNFMILYRLLPSSKIGAWALFISIYAISDSLRKALIYTPLIRISAIEKPSNYNKIISNSFLANITYTVSIILLLQILKYRIALFISDDSIVYIFNVYSIALLPITVFYHLNYLQEVKMQFSGTFYSTSVQKLIFLGIIVFFYFSKNTLYIEDLIVFLSFSITISIIPSFMLARKFLTYSLLFDKRMFLGLLNYGRFTIATNISSMLLRSTDSWMLGGMLSTDAVALYTPAIRYSNLSEIPLGAFTSIAYPKIASQVRDGCDIKKSYESIVAILLAIMAPIIIISIIYADEIVLLIAGSGYEQSAQILKITVLIGIALIFKRQFGLIMNVIGRAKLNSQIVFSSALLNLILNYFFIRSNGVMGAALATLITHYLGMFIILIYLYVQYKISMFGILQYLFAFKNLLK